MKASGSISHQFIHIDKKHKLDENQSQISSVRSIRKPLERGFPLNLELKDTNQTRRLNHYKRYEKIWKNFENEADKHH
jgi:hypothetical protein